MCTVCHLYQPMTVQNECLIRLVPPSNPVSKVTFVTYLFQQDGFDEIDLFPPRCVTHHDTICLDMWNVCQSACNLVNFGFWKLNMLEIWFRLDFWIYCAKLEDTAWLNVNLCTSPRMHLGKMTVSTVMPMLTIKSWVRINFQILEF